MSKTTALIAGASAGVGRALANCLAAEGHQLLLIARDLRDLEAIAADCHLRYGVRVEVLAIDLSAHCCDFSPLLSVVHSLGGRIDWLFLTAGASSAADDHLPSPTTLHEMLAVNFTGPAQLLILAANHASSWSLKSMVVCSSIAAAAPRDRNIAYSASKAALETFCLSLRRSLAPLKVTVQIYVLGYVDTALSFGQKLRFPVASPEATAQTICDHRNREFGRRFYPAFWWPIVTILRWLPWWIYRRLSF